VVDIWCDSGGRYGCDSGGRYLKPQPVTPWFYSRLFCCQISTTTITPIL